MGKKRYKARVLFYGQCYYNNWYLSRELRKLGWKADLVNWDDSIKNKNFYHGQDIQFYYRGIRLILNFPYRIYFYFKIFFSYDIIHFTNRGGIGYFWEVYYLFEILRISNLFPFFKLLDIKLFKLCGKKIVYTNNGCQDGLFQTTWMSFKPYSPCESCIWYNTKRKDVCSDEGNKKWAVLRNSIADYQCMLGGYSYDFNNNPKIHEVPEVYCLDKNFWGTDILIPTNYKLFFPENIIKIFHSIGNYEIRSQAVSNINIKCTHIYLPLIERLKKEGFPVEMIFFNDIENKKLRYYQAQADIIVDMLTVGFFGANIREGMMLGKPCICYLRPEFLDNMRKEIPEYVDNLPVVSATPDTIYDVLVDLINNPQKRMEIGKKSREFAVKYFSSEIAAKKFEQIYSELLKK